MDKKYIYIYNDTVAPWVQENKRSKEAGSEVKPKWKESSQDVPIHHHWGQNRVNRMIPKIGTVAEVWLFSKMCFQQNRGTREDMPSTPCNEDILHTKHKDLTNARQGLLSYNISTFTNGPGIPLPGIGSARLDSTHFW